MEIRHKLSRLTKRISCAETLIEKKEKKNCICIYFGKLVEKNKRKE